MGLKELLQGKGKKKAREVERYDKFFLETDEFSLNGITYRLITGRIKDIHAVGLLELPTGEMYRVKWTETLIPTRVSELVAIQYGENISDMRSVVAEQFDFPKEEYVRKLTVRSAFRI